MYLTFSLVLLDFLSHCQAPGGLCFQLWYLDDGILVGTLSALSSFLDVLQHQGPSYGCTLICLNVKCSGLQVINLLWISLKLLSV